jgi:hypothetical protein
MRLGVPCPGCGATVALGAAEDAVLCGSCGTAHLVLRGRGLAVAALPGRMDAEEVSALAVAAVAGELARRGRRGPPPTVEDAVPFFAPVRILVARLHEAAVVRGTGGDPVAAVAARLVETASTALRDPLGLPTAPPLAEVGNGPLPLVTRRAVTAPPFDADDAAFVGDGRRAADARTPDALTRRAVAVPLSRTLLLRPCRLVSVSAGRARAQVLVDDAARQATALLSSGAAEALREEIAERPLEDAGGPLLRPMRCPACASPCPLDREGQLRICPSCRRAWLVAGHRLPLVSYSAELPPSPRGRLLFPAWRVPFSLVDPVDGRELASLAEVEARCGAPTAGGDSGPAPLDVPAFFPVDRGREQRGTHRLLGLPPPAFPLLPGPAHEETGFPEPRLVGAIGPEEAVAVLRHALLASLRPATVALASPRRLGDLLFRAPLQTGTPRLVLRALRRVDAEPCG